MEPLKIAIIGRGNVATHLSRAFAGPAEVTMVNPRTLDSLPADADLCLISVSDDAIPAVASRLAALDAVVAHTSGTTPMSVLAEAGCRRTAVLYPLQTFSKDVPLDYAAIPVFIEGNSDESLDIARRAAELFSEKIIPADSDVRRKLHIASVLSCNFVNHLWALSEELLAEDGISFDLLRPLIAETLRKTSEVSPKQGQTGPARRHDRRTIDAHLEMLADRPVLHQIYSLLSQSISDTYLLPK